ncbi:unnamed protein product, partial [Didymodactylos carnosus]
SMYPYQNNSQPYGSGYGLDPNQSSGFGYPSYPNNNQGAPYPPSGPGYPTNQNSIPGYVPQYPGAYSGTPVYQQSTPYPPADNRPYNQYGSGIPPPVQPSYNPTPSFGSLYETPYGGSNSTFSANNNTSPYPNTHGSSPLLKHNISS